MTNQPIPYSQIVSINTGNNCYSSILATKTDNRVILSIIDHDDNNYATIIPVEKFEAMNKNIDHLYDAWIDQYYYDMIN